MSPLGTRSCFIGVQFLIPMSALRSSSVSSSVTQQYPWPGDHVTTYSSQASESLPKNSIAPSA